MKKEGEKDAIRSKQVLPRRRKAGRIPQSGGGLWIAGKNTLFHQLDGYITAKPSHLNAKGSLACVTKDGNIYVNMRANLSPEQWCYVMAHNLLHLAFGHFDKASILPTANLSRHSGTKPVISTLPDSFMTSASASRSAQIRRKHIRSN